MEHKRAIFQTEDIWIDQWEAYFSSIRDEDFSSYPSKFNFARKLKIGYRTVLNTFNNLYPSSKSVFNDMLADILAEGMIKNKYNATSTIFTLKNMCGWVDKKETVSTVKKLDELVDKETAKKGILEYMKKNDSNAS